MSTSSEKFLETADNGTRAVSQNSRRDATAMAIRTGRGLLVPRIAILLVVGALLPILASHFGGYEARYVLAISIPYAIAILGGNMVASTAGDINLAIGAEMAIGAYVGAYGEVHHFGLGLSVLLAVAAATAAAFFLSLGVSRLQGVYTALATFALAFCIPDLVTFFVSLTGGGLGEYVSPVKVVGLSIGGGTLATDYSGMILFVAVGVIWLLSLSGRMGRTLMFLGEAEPALAAFGRSPYWLKVGIWTSAGVTAGLAGVLYGLSIGYLNPQEFTFYLSLYLFVGGVVGGTATVMGALLGGLLIGALPIYLSTSSGGVEPIVLGVILLLVLVFGSKGLWPRVEVLVVGAYNLLRKSGRDD